MKKLISLTIAVAILMTLGVAFADPVIQRVDVLIRGDRGTIGTISTRGYVVNDEVYIPLTAVIRVLRKDALPLPARDQLLGGEDGLIYAPFISFATERGYKVTRDVALEAKIDALKARMAKLPFARPFNKSVVLNVIK
ncbi:hypothetical protein AN618_21380 [Fervidicola ferrireducens]|uniref:Uncharacterized protein n=1 Tax=Fervidicola ferrireducens TaxID=520764 RepID=A0A140L2Y8_9FIRM|nr:hypothetical protein [Fervidicola ferrireducens]KXG74913.1 hypothetical protein AN618_21380 [Fervidicola ferrireducens]